MPTFKGQLSEEDLLRLITYIKGLRPAGGEAAAAGGDLTSGAFGQQGGTR